MRFSFFKILNSFAGRWPALDYTAVFFASVFPYLMVLFLLVFSFLTKNLLLFFIPLFSGFISRFIITQAIYFLYKRNRPCKLNGAKVLIPIPKTSSFPSGHASFFFGFSFAILLFNIPLAIIFITGTCLMALARVFSGVHWFRDILGGMAVGLISAILINLFIVGH